MPTFSSFNAFGSESLSVGQSHVPVWLGVVSPRPVGGTLATDFVKSGLRVPAGTAINLTSKIITPYLTFVVEDVATSSSTVTGVTISIPDDYGYIPAVGDYLFIVDDSSFASNGSPVAITAVAANATDSSQYDITVALTGASDGDIVALAFSSSAMPVPNAYLYNDIYVGALEGTPSSYDLAASGAAVDFHGEGLLIELTPSAGIATAMKAAVPNVIQVTV